MGQAARNALAPAARRILDRAKSRRPAPSYSRYPARPFVPSASPRQARRAASVRASGRRGLSRWAGSRHARAREPPYRLRRRGRGLGPRRRLAPAVRLAGDVGAIAALSPLVPPPTSDYVSWALLAFRAAGHRHLQEPIDALRVPRCL